MRRPVTFALLALAAVFTLAPTAGANIIGWDCNSDGDGAIDCSTAWDPNTYDLTITGNQVCYPGHMIGSFTTDTETDPNVNVRNAIDNDTWFAWTGYIVNVYMNKPFALSNSTVYAPTGWSGLVTQDPNWNGSEYAGQITYTAGTTVGIGDTLDFGYRMSFLGSVQYCQEMIPVPEPLTMGLLAVGGVALLKRRR